jgi:hypothetical protein
MAPPSNPGMAAQGQLHKAHLASWYIYCYCGYLQLQSMAHYHASIMPVHGMMPGQSR